MISLEISLIITNFELRIGKMMYHESEKLMRNLEDLSAEEILLYSKHNFAENVVFASSLGLEDQVLLDMIMRNNIKIDIFTLDTGRLFDETYQLIQKSEEKYNCKIKIYFPNQEAVEQMVWQYGINLFYESSVLRKECCHIRKLEPLSRALTPYDAWICGRRQRQSSNRTNSKVIKVDNNKRFKINPLYKWTEKELWNYIRKYDVPYNPLHDENFPSIGCACCTRAVRSGENLRSGRWWREAP